MFPSSLLKLIGINLDIIGVTRMVSLNFCIIYFYVAIARVFDDEKFNHSIILVLIIQYCIVCYIVLDL